MAITSETQRLLGIALGDEDEALNLTTAIGDSNTLQGVYDSSAGNTTIDLTTLNEAITYTSAASGGKSILAIQTLSGYTSDSVQDGALIAVNVNGAPEFLYAGVNAVGTANYITTLTNSGTISSALLGVANVGAGSALNLELLANPSGATMTGSLLKIQNLDTAGNADVQGIEFDNRGDAGDIKFSLRASDPTSPVEGEFWYNTTTNVLKFYNGTAVRTITST